MRKFYQPQLVKYYIFQSTVQLPAPKISQHKMPTPGQCLVAVFIAQFLKNWTLQNPTLVTFYEILIGSGSGILIIIMAYHNPLLELGRITRSLTWNPRIPLVLRKIIIPTIMCRFRVLTARVSNGQKTQPVTEIHESSWWFNDGVLISWFMTNNPRLIG